jgi:hypothetical protein
MEERPDKTKTIGLSEHLAMDFNWPFDLLKPPPKHEKVKLSVKDPH